VRERSSGEPRALIKKAPLGRYCVLHERTILEVVALTRNEDSEQWRVGTDAAREGLRLSGDRVQLQQVMLTGCQ